jgi:anti-sigma factor RsiW
VICAELGDRIEAIAAGDQPLEGEPRLHIESCPSCAAALATARRIDRYLAARSTPPAPANFTSSILSRIRREQWRSEERVDRLFNVAMVCAVTLVVVGAAFLFNMSAVVDLATGASRLLSTAGEEALRRAAPMMGTYVAGTALLLTALAMWWWADMGTR